MFVLQKYEIYKNYQLSLYRQKQNILSEKLSLTSPYEGSLATALCKTSINKIFWTVIFLKYHS